MTISTRAIATTDHGQKSTANGRLACCRFHAALLFSAILSSGCSSQPDFVSLQDQARDLVARGDNAAEQDNLIEAHELYTKALRSGGVDREAMPTICRKRLVTGAKLGKYDEAEIDLQAIFELSTSPAEGLVLHSYLLKKQGQLKEAELALRQARRIAPNIKPFAE